VSCHYEQTEQFGTGAAATEVLGHVVSRQVTRGHCCTLNDTVACIFTVHRVDYTI